MTYGQLLDEVCRFANGLRKLGIKKGDRVAVYMPMIVELPIAMLACARIGAAHSVIFGGFSPDSIVDRVNDSECVAVITADYGWRRGKKVPLKANVDEAIAKGMPSLEHVVVAKRIGDPVEMVDGRDVWWDDVVRDQSSVCEPERMNAEDLLYLLYTSGTTAKPKGIKHTTAGYLTGVTATHKLVFDLKEDTDVYWCAADIGWVTGHSYIVYGPLCNGATSVIYEGTPDFPDKDRLWEIVERYKVTILYTAPTAIRTFMKWGTEYPEKHDMSSLRVLGSVGEPINPEAWIWYHEHIGGGRCPVVDTWWQTETGAIMIAPLPGITTLKPGSATKPFPGVYADIVNDKGESVPLGGGGYVVLTKPWPSMLRGIYGDDERYVQTYWSKFPHRYLAGDGCKRDEEGDYWFMGRIDDVMNVSGHRISTTEVESALVDHPDVAEAAVTGKNGRHHRPSDLRVRVAQVARERLAGIRRRAARPRRREARQVLPPEVPDVHARAAEDALGQDHAPPAARHRGRPHAGRHDDARGFDGGARAAATRAERGVERRLSQSQPRSRAMRAASVRFAPPTLPIASLR